MAIMNAPTLNCSIIWQNTMLDEQAFAPGRRISVGEDHRATFTLPASLGTRQQVFYTGKTNCQLFLRDGMRGKVQMKGRTWELDERFKDPQD